jgi:hypothetical protein
VSESETGRAPPESVLQRILSLRINTSIIIKTHEMMVQAESDITAAAAAAVRALNRLTPPCKFVIQIYIFGGKNKAGSTFCGQTSCRGLRPQNSHCGIAQRAFFCTASN